jgi:lipoprotein signal peptidase
MPNKTNGFHLDRLKVELGLFCLVIGIDQWSKWRVGQGSRLVLNQGGIWGVLPGSFWTWLIGGLWLLLAWFYFSRKHRMNEWLALGLITAAGLSNLIDRLVFGSVRDFIYYPGIGVYGNIADIILGIGVVWLILQKR